MKTNYIKRTQKDYSLSLKLQIVQEVEQVNYQQHKLNGSMVFKPGVQL